jgi:hypothetical protein
MLTTETILWFLIFIIVILIILQMCNFSSIIGIMSLGSYFKKLIGGGIDKENNGLSVFFGGEDECMCPCCDVPCKECYCGESCPCRREICGEISKEKEGEEKEKDEKEEKEVEKEEKEEKEKTGSFFGGFKSWLFGEEHICSCRSGANDLDYLNNENITIIPLTTMDTKNITSAKLRSCASKLNQLEAFVDKLVNNTVILIRSVKKSPTDLTSSILANHKTLLMSASEYIAKKPESRFTANALRELANRAGETIKNAGELTKLGNISQAELAIKYAAAITENGCGNSVELATCKKDNEYLRTNNERMRDEARRGLTNYTCEVLLKDCLAERDRLKRELDLSRTEGNSSRVRELQNEVSELHGVVRVLQEEELKANNLNASYRAKISELERELREHQEALKEVLKEVLKD